MKKIKTQPQLDTTKREAAEDELRAFLETIGSEEWIETFFGCGTVFLNKKLVDGRQVRFSIWEPSIRPPTRRP